MCLNTTCRSYSADIVAPFPNSDPKVQESETSETLCFPHRTLDTVIIETPVLASIMDWVARAELTLVYTKLIGGMQVANMPTSSVTKDGARCTSPWKIPSLVPEIHQTHRPNLGASN